MALVIIFPFTIYQQENIVVLSFLILDYYKFISTFTLLLENTPIWENNILTVLCCLGWNEITSYNFNWMEIVFTTTSSISLMSSNKSSMPPTTETTMSSFSSLVISLFYLMTCRMKCPHLWRMFRIVNLQHL